MRLAALEPHHLRHSDPVRPGGQVHGAQALHQPAVHRGCATQRLKPSTSILSILARRSSRARSFAWTGILLKINLKLGGINVVSPKCVPRPQRPCFCSIWKPISDRLCSAIVTQVDGRPRAAPREAHHRLRRRYQPRGAQLVQAVVLRADGDDGRGLRKVLHHCRCAKVAAGGYGRRHLQAKRAYRSPSTARPGSSHVSLSPSSLRLPRDPRSCMDGCVRAL